MISGFGEVAESSIALRSRRWHATLAVLLVSAVVLARSALRWPAVVPRCDAVGGGGQFGVLEVDDTGATVRVRLTGRNWREEILLSYEFTVDARLDRPHAVGQ